MTDELTMNRSLSKDLSRLANCRKTQAALQDIARRILGDRSAAEDAVQGAYLSAWQRPPRRLSFAWMKRAVVRRSIDHKRKNAARPMESAALDEHPSSGWERAGLLASLDAHRDLGVALAGLPTAQGEALYLRYFEGLPPKAIARQLDLPLETVKTQLARGLQSRRKTLDSPGGGNRLSLRGLALVAFGAGSRAPAAAANTTFLAHLFVPTWFGSISMMKWIVASCVLLLSGLVGLWAFTPDNELEPIVAAARRAEDAELVPIPSEVETPSIVGVRTEAKTAGEPIVTPSERPYASERSLDVAVTWSDGSPAVGTTVGVHLDEGAGQERLLSVVGVGPDGRARLDDCPAGEYRVASGIRGEARVEAWALGAAIGTIEIPDGVRVSGVVTDAEEVPIAWAQLWVLTTLSGWQEHVEIGRTDSRGRFELRDVPLYAAVGVTANGYAPSRWSPVSRMEVTGTREDRDRAATLSIRLTKGGASLRGVVSGPDGEAISGAQLAFNTMVMGGALDPVGLEKVQRYVRANPDGAYVIEGLQMGALELACVGEGFAGFEAEIHLADGAAETLDIKLSPGGSVTGVVTDSVGAPMAGVSVGAFTEAKDLGALKAVGFQREVVLGWPCGKTDESGRYRLDGVAAGTAFIYALGPMRSDGATGYRHRIDKAQLEVSAGEGLTWNGMIGPGSVIQGTLFYADRAPAKGITVAAISESTDDMRFYQARADGSYRFENLEDDSYEVMAAFPLIDETVERVSAPGVKPNGLPIELVAPTALALEPTARPGTSSIVGAVADPHARMGKWASYFLETSLGDRVEQVRAGSERTFSFTDLAAGSYRFRIRTSGLHTLLVTDVFDVAAGESKDLGTLELGPAGGQRVHFLRDPDWPETSGFFTVRSSDGVQVVADMFRGTDDLIEVKNLNPGRYTARVHEGHLVERGIEFEVVAGEVGDVDFPFEVGVDLTVEVRFRPSLFSTSATRATAPSSRASRQPESNQSFPSSS